jgi:hypothetical protein
MGHLAHFSSMQQMTTLNCCLSNSYALKKNNNHMNNVVPEIIFQIKNYINSANMNG